MRYEDGTYIFVILSCIRIKGAFSHEKTGLSPKWFILYYCIKSSVARY